MDAEQIPITQHVQDYLAYLENRGFVPLHISAVRQRLAWILEQTKITRLSQLRPSLVTSALATLRESGRADRTVSHFCTSLKAFSRWAWKDRRTRTVLLEDLERPRVISERRRDPLSPEQISKLISTTRAGQQRRGLSGEDRAWLYTLASVTGLRRSELQSLTRVSFNLDSLPPVVTLPGRDTKNGCAATQPVPSGIVPELKTWLESKPEGTPLFKRDRNSTLMIRADLKAAGIEPSQYDFHGLRHAFVTQVVQGGASVRDAMTLARHHSPDLTLNRYSHSRLEDLSALVDKLPILSHALPTCGVSAGPNGTTWNHQEPGPEEPQIDSSRHVFQSG
jgi:integrase